MTGVLVVSPDHFYLCRGRLDILLCPQLPAASLLGWLKRKHYSTVTDVVTFSFFTCLLCILCVDRDSLLHSILLYWCINFLLPFCLLYELF